MTRLRQYFGGELKILLLHQKVIRVERGDRENTDRNEEKHYLISQLAVNYFIAHSVFMGSIKHSKASKKRWDDVPAEERSERMRAIALARHAKMTPEEKAMNAKRMVAARLKKQKANASATSNQK